MKDEPFYIIMYEHPKQYPFFSDFGLILHAFPSLDFCTALQLRVLALIQLVISSTILSCGVVKWWQTINAEQRLPLGIWIGAIATTILGGLQGGKWCLLSNYDILSNFLLFSAIGLCFFALTDNPRRCSWLLFASGFLIGIGIFVKFSCAGSVFALLCLLLACNLRKHVMPFALFAVGILSGIATYFGCFRSLDSFLTGPFWGLTEAWHGHHQPLHILQKQFVNLRGPVFEIVTRAVCTVVFLEAYRWLCERLSHRQKLPLFANWAGAVILLLTLSLALLGGGYLFYSMAAGLVLFLAGYCLRENLRLTATAALGLLILGTLPVALSFGTEWSDLLIHTTCHQGSGFLFLFLLSTLIRPRVLHLMLTSAIPVFAAVTFIVPYVYQPHPVLGMSSSIEQTEPSTLPKLKGLLLEPSQKKFLEKSYELLCHNGFQSGDQFFSAEGLILSPFMYSFDASTPGLPFAEPKLTRDNAKLIEGFLKRNPREKIYVAMFDWCQNFPPDINSAFSNNGISFPADFEYLGSIQNPISFPQGKTKFWKYPLH